MKLDDEKWLAEFRERLLQWFTGAQRDLPWRKTRDPYSIWISEVMLQQTQVKTVLKYYSRFLQAFPDVETLAHASQQQVLKIWEGLGYYARARNLHKAAKYMVEHMGARIPSTYDELRRIPGIGEYTAAAVASIAFGEPRAAVDGNVRRVLCRIFRFEEDVHSQKARDALQAYADRLLSPDRPGDFNQAMMELGATLCTPRKPKCLLCPVSRFCRARLELDDPAMLPLKRQTRAVPHYRVAVGIIWDEGYIFIDRRDENGMLGGLWEFPGGKIENGETAQEAVRREIKEELDLDIEVGDFYMEVRHAYSHFKITMYVYHCLYKGGEPRLTAARDWRWVKPEELRFYPFAAATQKVIRRLESEFCKPPERRPAAGRR